MATAAADLTVKLWNLDTGKRLETFRGPTGVPRVLNFCPSGQRFACASEDRTVRIWEPKSLSNEVLNAISFDGSEDLLARLTTDDVARDGNGWTLSGGVLMSGQTELAAIPLPGAYARNSYAVRVSLRRVGTTKGLSVILPVADQQVAFDLDASPRKGSFTGLSMIDGKIISEQPGAVEGQKINDAEPHVLEITVRLSARTAQIESWPLKLE